MRLGVKYRLKHFISIKKHWNKKIISFRILCEWGFDIDLRHDSIIDLLLTGKEKKLFIVLNKKILHS